MAVVPLASRARTWCLVAAAAGAVGAGCAARKAAGPAALPGVGGPGAVPAAEASASPEPWIAELQVQLQSLRGLPFRRPVPYEMQDRAAYRRTVREELAAELPPEKAADMSRASVALGMMRADVSLLDVLERALGTQVAAYYDPRIKKFRIVDAGRRGSEDEHHTVAAHELAHALQDQHFNLRAFTGSAGSADQDERLARRFVTEGEATFLMLARELGSGSPAKLRLGPLAVAALRMNITMLAAADMLELVSTLRMGSGSDALDPEALAEMLAFKELPPMVTLPMVEPYLKGALFVSEVWASGGWPAVDALYRSPPQSTEQALHPREKFIAARDLPMRVEASAIRPPPGLGAGARLLDSDVIGELGWRTYFRTWDHPAPEAAAAGWGGDRYWTWAAGARTAAVVATVWDSEADARRFAAAFEETLAARLSAPTIAADGHHGFRVRGRQGSMMSVRCRGRRVDIVDGLLDAELNAVQVALGAATFRPVGPSHAEGGR